MNVEEPLKGHVRRNVGVFALALGKALAGRRRAAGLTLRDLSLVSGVGIATLSKLENGAQDVRLSTVERVMAALRIDSAGVVEALMPGREVQQDAGGEFRTDQAEGYDPEELG